MRQYESEADRLDREQAERDADRETEAENAYADRWGDLTLDHQTDTDPSLDHQVVIYVTQKGQDVNVSCNCLAYQKGVGSLSHRPMGRVHNLDQSRDLYNDPANHDKPFTETDRARW